MTSAPIQSRSCVVLALALLVSPSAAQWPTLPTSQQPLGQQPAGQQPAGQGANGQDPQGQQTIQWSPYDPRQIQAPSLDQAPGYPRFDPDNLFPTWVRPDAFQGFPVFPPSLGGYGSYPTGPVGAVQLPTGAGQLPPPAPPRAPDWPAWIQARKKTLPYEPGTAVVVRQADRVWFRVPGEAAFVPLYHYDNARGLPAGSEIQVRMAGEFLLLLHGGSRLSSFGSADLKVDALDDQEARITVSSFTYLNLSAANKGLVCTLPDGSVLSLQAPSAGGGGAGMLSTLPLGMLPAVGEAKVLIERSIEPDRYGGRASIFNHGKRPVQLQTAQQSLELQPGQRVTILLTPPAGAIGAELREEHAAALASGPRRIWQATENGSVSWSGARFVLQPGAELEFDPLQGDPFGRQ